MLQRPARAQEAPHGVLARVREVLQVQLILSEPRTPPSADEAGAPVPQLDTQPRLQLQGRSQPSSKRAPAQRARFAHAARRRAGALRQPPQRASEHGVRPSPRPCSNTVRQAGPAARPTFCAARTMSGCAALGKSFGVLQAALAVRPVVNSWASVL